MLKLIHEHVKCSEKAKEGLQKKLKDTEIRGVSNSVILKKLKKLDLVVINSMKLEKK
jgi:hypothetical protein